MNFFVLKLIVFRKLNNSSEMQNDALMHRDGLQGYPRTSQKYMVCVNTGLLQGRAP